MPLVSATDPHAGVHPWNLTCGAVFGDFTWCRRRGQIAELEGQRAGIERRRDALNLELELVNGDIHALEVQASAGYKRAARASEAT